MSAPHCWPKLRDWRRATASRLRALVGRNERHVSPRVEHAWRITMTAPLRRGALFLLITLSLHYGLAYAQGTGGVIDGHVKDPDSKPTPGVQVIVNSPSLIQKD